MGFFFVTEVIKMFILSQGVLMLRKTLLSVLGMATTGVLFAGTMGPVCTPGNVTVPCEARHWSLGLQGLYLNVAQGAARDHRIVTVPATFTSLDDQWSWGFKAEGAAQFGQGNDIAVSWMHFADSSQQAGLATPFVQGVATLSLPYSLINRARFDQVNLVGGQEVDFSVMGKAHFYGGLQYASIQSTALNVYSALPFPVTNTGGLYNDVTNFKGVGPVIGVDYSYGIYNGLNLVAKGASSLVYGTTRLNNGFTLSPSSLNLVSAYASKKIITPGFDAKLGLNYGYEMAQGTLNLEGGYQVTYYLNAIQTQPGLLQVATRPVESSDFGLYGPYIGLKYVGMA